MKFRVFWYAAPCIHVEVDQRFRGAYCLQPHPGFCTMGTGGHFPGDKERPGRDADHSPPSSAEYVNE
jgi:hypothetical protein